jgi:hypothetical protein
VSGPGVEEMAKGYVGLGNGYCFGSVVMVRLVEGGEVVTDNPWTASSASSRALPNKKGLIEVVCSRAKMDVFTAATSVEERVSAFAMTGITFVRLERRCMNSTSLEIS